ncbi:MAG: DUF416 family protein [Polyangiaceae bacterium]|nr:DUF416 family protein [Polyangiaceae bacterium]
METAFNNQKTRNMLSKLRVHQQLALGAACCERMLPSYEAFVQEVGWGDIAPLRRALDAVWKACEEKPLSNLELRDLLSQCEMCAPNSEDFDSLYTSLAQDAAFAICALLDFLFDGDLNRIVSVFQMATDSVDLIVQEREGMDPRDSFRESKILKHPLMQQELVRQRRDIAEANTIEIGDTAARLIFRSRARSESNLVLELKTA